MNQPLQNAQGNQSTSTEQQGDDFARLLNKDATGVPDITFNDSNFVRAERLAKLMASGASTIPQHLRGNVADCFAIVLQTFAWGLNNPFAVAQKTHLVNGALGYEAQLVNAVIQSAGIIVGHFMYEYKGEDQSLECRAGARIKGSDELLWSEWLSVKNITTKNSPLWKTNPKQQIGYLQVKNWARAFYPGALLGVYTTDELFDGVGVQYDKIQPEDLSTPQAEVDAVLKEIESSTTLQELELTRAKASVIKGDGYKTAKSAYAAKKKALAVAESKPNPEQNPVEDTEEKINSAVVSDDDDIGIYNDAIKAANAGDIDLALDLSRGMHPEDRNAVLQRIDQYHKEQEQQASQAVQASTRRSRDRSAMGID